MLALLLILGTLGLIQTEPNVPSVETRFSGVPTGFALRSLHGVDCRPNYTSIVNQGELTFAKGKLAVRIQKPTDNLEQLQCQNSSSCTQPDLWIDLIECDNKAADEVWRCRTADNSSRLFSSPIINCEQDLDPSFRKNFCMLDGSCVLRYTISQSAPGLSPLAIVTLVAAGIGLVAVVGMLVVRNCRRRLN